VIVIHSDDGENEKEMDVKRMCGDQKERKRTKESEGIVKEERSAKVEGEREEVLHWGSDSGGCRESQGFLSTFSSKGRRP